MRIKNHYVSQSYLRNWCNPNGKIWTYRRLVAREDEQLWKEHSPGSIAYLDHLYVHHAKADSLEIRFAKDFENPAAGPLRRAVTEQRLSSEDWNTLIRFAALHDVRNPVRLMEHMKRMPQVLDELIQELELDKPITMEKIRADNSKQIAKKPSEQIPINVTPVFDGEGLRFRIETGFGRQSWHSAIELVIEDTIQKLPSKGWTIVKPYLGMKWISSDNPVIRLGFRTPNDYALNTGWGVPSANIMLPLDPDHLLFVEVGKKSIPRGQRLGKEQTEFIRKIAAENAYMRVLAIEQDEDVHRIAPRTVNLEKLNSERDFWMQWAADNAEMERRYLKDSQVF